MIIVKVVILILIYTSFGFSNDRELYKTILETLIGAGELEEALQVAQKGTEMFPEDIYWWEKYAQLLIWNNKLNEALDVLIKAGELFNNRDFLRKAFELALKLRDYNKASLLISKTDVSQEKALEVYRGEGNIYRLIEYLKSKEDKESLSMLIDILVFLGELNEALKIIEKMKNLYGYDVNLAMLEANIYYKKGNFVKSLSTLKKFMELVDEDNTEFWMSLSDIAWDLRDYETSLTASMKLIRLNKARREDYFRVFAILIHKDIEKAILIARESYKRFGSSDLFKKGLYVLHDNNRIEELIIFIENIIKMEEGIIDKDIAELYVHSLSRLGKYKKAVNFIESFLKKHKNSTLIAQYIYMLIELELFHKLKDIIYKYSDEYKDDETVTKALISGYIVLGYPRKAFILYKKRGIKDRILLYEIFNAMGRKNEAFMIKYREFSKIKRIIENGNHISNVEIDVISRYMYLGISFLSKHQYEKLLEITKDILPDNIWQEFYQSFLIKYRRYKELEYIASRKESSIKRWVRINLFLLGYSVRIDDIFKTPKEKALIYYKEGNYLKAYSYMSIIASEYIYDRGFVNTFINSYRFLKDKVKVNLKLEDWGAYKEIEKRFIYESTYSIDVYFDAITPATQPIGQWYKAGVSYNHDYSKTNIRTSIGILKKLKTVPILKFEISEDITKDLKVNVEWDFNAEPKDTIYMYLNLLEDSVKINSKLYFQEDLSLDVSYQVDFYKNYNYENIGISNGFNINIHGPAVLEDIFRISLGYEFRDYTNYTDNILPVDFHNIIIYLNTYESVRLLSRIETYISGGIGYNSAFGNSFFVSGGFKSRIFGIDELSLNLNLSRNTVSVEDTLVVFELSYLWLF